ncbi:hypothetical protein N658DRAFT_100056 [Parathielavia hyrcaniae]|uniref:Uncharacterized protein n=1 Tax=Parathielavia hyrcaniae TaxID=113614 RepID=A0AAN6PRM4_9PEZI|nr:hypothetical protein N658DRAFT_100056 [Parathielavia hyrcaniae]
MVFPELANGVSFEDFDHAIKNHRSLIVFGRDLAPESKNFQGRADYISWVHHDSTSYLHCKYKRYDVGTVLDTGIASASVVIGYPGPTVKPAAQVSLALTDM